MPIHNENWKTQPGHYLYEQVAEDFLTWEQIAKAFIYNLSHDQIQATIEDQDLEPRQECEICHEYFSIDDLTVEEHSEVVCCQTCLPERQEESRQEQLEDGMLECTDCGQEQLNEDGECPTCKEDPEY